jgi:putative colanic acid biosynthesis acetyltransferase WcaB
MNFVEFIFQDWRANKGNSKGRIILVAFRLANIATKSKLLFFLSFPYRLSYKIIVEWILTIEIPWNLSVGRNFILYHGQGLVIHKLSLIGENCTLRHCTTIGTKVSNNGTVSSSPILGDNIDVGSNTCIIGGIVIGNNTKIGCGSVVVHNIVGNSVVVGNPAIEKPMPSRSKNA